MCIITNFGLLMLVRRHRSYVKIREKGTERERGGRGGGRGGVEVARGRRGQIQLHHQVKL